MKLLFVLSCVVFVESARKLPSFVEVCPRDNKEASECLTRNVKNLTPMLGKGIPELFIPPLAPLVLQSAEIATSPSFTCSIKNAKVYHLDNWIIGNIFINFDTKSWGADVTFPVLEVESDYKMNGKILVLELNSEGKSRGNMTEVKTNIFVSFDVVTRYGKEHLHITGTKIKMDIGKCAFEFDDLFKGNEDLTQRANQILNENYQVLLEEFSPVFEKIIATLTENVVESIYKKYPFDILYPKKN
ncbi:circadian clock-controlled protein daywake-like [Diabrotica undecimpunctata]|uniref:circadian clock-controlled protein daywake-like n=1 Tax=Diabrotica undecimpunctata TaxID=50387 RepID=UPI003B63249F